MEYCLTQRRPILRLQVETLQIETLQIGALQIKAPQLGLMGLPAHLTDYGGDAVLHFVDRIAGEGVTEVFDDIKTLAAAQYSQADYVEDRVQQVRAMRRRLHQVFVDVFGIVIEGDVFSLLIELEIRHGCEAFG